MKQMQYQFMLLLRNHLIVVSILLTLIYAIVFYAIKDLGESEKILTLLIYNDPAMIGLLFVGLVIILEKNQSVLAALFVTPSTLHVYLLSRLIPLTLVGWACAFGMAISVLGTDFSMMQFSFGVAATCLLFGLMGICIVSYASEFLSYMLLCIPVLLIMSLPLLNYFDVTDIYLFRFFPTASPMTMIAESYQQKSTALVDYLFSSCWLALLYWLAYRLFEQRVRAR